MVDYTGSDEPVDVSTFVATIETVKRWVEDYLDATQEHRDRAATRRDYRCGIQWTDEEIQALQNGKQPVVTYNYVGEKVGTMVGAEVVGRTVPNAVGRNAGQDQATASVVTAAIRYVTDEADWDGERTAGREQLFVEGVVGTEISVNPALVRLESGDEIGPSVQTENPEITIKHIPYDRLFWDPMSRFDDFRDAKYYGTVVWQDLDEAVAQWPEHAEMLKSSVSRSSSSDEDLDDKPDNWVSGSDRKRVRVATIWFRLGGTWMVATFCSYAFLDGPRISPFVDDRDRRIPGMVLRSALTSRRENERIGPVQDLISPQDEVNKRRSKALHLMNTKQLLAHEGAFRDLAKARRLLHQPDAIIEYHPAKSVQVLDHQAQVVENLQLLQDARAAFEQLGPPESLTGQIGSAASGVAIERRQAGAMLRFGHYISNAMRWELNVYRHVWFRIRQFWQAPDYVRITEDASSPTYLEINKPITVGDLLVQRGMDPQMLSMLEQTGQLAQAGIDISQQVGVINNLQQLDVDVLIESRPASPTYRHDQIAALADMMGKLSLPPEAASAATEILLEMVDIDPRIKTKLLDNLKPDPQQQQLSAQLQAQQMAMQQQLSSMQMAKLQADVEKTMAQVAKIQAEAGKTMAEIDETETASIENVANANRSMADAGAKGGSSFSSLILGQ